MAIATDCKSVLFGVQWFESTLPHNLQRSGSSSFGRAIAFQAIGGGFEPRLPLNKKAVERQEKRRRFKIKAAVAQLVERILGKDEVTGSNPVCSSFFM